MLVIPLYHGIQKFIILFGCRIQRWNSQKAIGSPARIPRSQFIQPIRQGPPFRDPLRSGDLMLLLANRLIVIIYLKLDRMPLLIETQVMFHLLRFPFHGLVHAMSDILDITVKNIVHHIKHHRLVSRSRIHQTPQLLFEERVALCPAQEDSRCDIGHMHTLVQHIHTEEYLHTAGRSMFQHLIKTLGCFLVVSGVIIYIRIERKTSLPQ